MKSRKQDDRSAQKQPWPNPSDQNLLRLRVAIAHELKREVARLSKNADLIKTLDREVIVKASDVFESAAEAAHWLASPLPLMGNCSPAETACSARGKAQVLRILGAIEHGSFS